MTDVQAEADTLTASARLCQLLTLDPSTRLKPIDGWVVPAPLVPDPVPLADLLAIALMLGGGLAALQAMAVSTGLPFTLVLLGACYAIVVGLLGERREVRSAD